MDGNRPKNVCSAKDLDHFAVRGKGQGKTNT